MNNKDNAKIDCVNCKSFRTTTLHYPSGRCEILDELCGLGHYCNEFEIRK